MTGLNLWGYAWKSFERDQLDESEWIAWNRWFSGEMANDSWVRVYDKYRYGWVDEFQRHIDNVIEGR